MKFSKSCPQVLEAKDLKNQFKKEECIFRSGKHRGNGKKESASKFDLGQRIGEEREL